MSDPTEGLPFHHVYLRPDKPLRDSEKARTRLAAYADKYVSASRRARSSDTIDYLGDFLEIRLGISLPVGYQEPLGRFFRAGNLPNVLSAITDIAHWLRIDSRDAADRWLNFVKTVFEEEHLGYRLDTKGGVRLLVDEHYERNRASTVALLGDNRYGAVRGEFEKSDEFLTEGKTKEAVRALFEAIETLTKLMANDAFSALGPNEVDKYIRPIVASLYNADDVARGSANQLLVGFRNWINSAQPYRHGQHAVEPVDPPMGLTVALISTGTSYLRWLLEIDQQRQKT